MNKHLIEAANIRQGGCHHQAFTAWLGGAEIEMFNESSGMWERNYAPSFSAKMMYRAVEGIETDTALGNVVPIGVEPAPAPAPTHSSKFEPQYYYGNRGGTTRYLVLFDKRDISNYDPGCDPDGNRPLVVMDTANGKVSLRYTDGRKHNGRNSELDLMYVPLPADGSHEPLFDLNGIPWPSGCILIAKRPHPTTPLICLDATNHELRFMS